MSHWFNKSKTLIVTSAIASIFSEDCLSILCTHRFSLIVFSTFCTIYSMNCSNGSLEVSHSLVFLLHFSYFSSEIRMMIRLAVCRILNNVALTYRKFISHEWNWFYTQLWENRIVLHMHLQQFFSVVVFFFISKSKRTHYNCTYTYCTNLNSACIVPKRYWKG